MFQIFDRFFLLIVWFFCFLWTFWIIMWHLCVVSFWFLGGEEMNNGCFGRDDEYWIHEDFFERMKNGFKKRELPDDSSDVLSVIVNWKQAFRCQFPSIHHPFGASLFLNRKSLSQQNKKNICLIVISKGKDENGLFGRRWKMDSWRWCCSIAALMTNLLKPPESKLSSVFPKLFITTMWHHLHESKIAIAAKWEKCLLD